MESISCSSQTNNEDEDNDYRVKIDNLPNVVFEYILSYLSPYSDLIDCKLVSKSWQLSVKSTIYKLKRDFISSLINMTIEWHNYYPCGGPAISPRYSHSACCLGDSVYIFGGCTVANTTFNDLWRFDLSNRNWIRPIATGTFPSPKASASFVNYNDCIILFGGWSYSTSNVIYQEWRISNHVHVFDTKTNRWTLVDMKSYSPGLAGHSASIIGDKMIVFGGLQSQLNNIIPITSSNDIWVLDLKTWTWDKIIINNHVKPLPRYFHSQLVLDSNHLLIIGGCGGPNMLFNDIWLLYVPNDLSQPWQWYPIDIQLKDNAFAPLIAFQPACKIGNVVVVLDTIQKFRNLQCKDGRILKKLAERSQFVNNNDNSNNNQEVIKNSKVKLKPQISVLSLPSTSSTSESSILHNSFGSNAKSTKNRQRQLEGLDRMEERIKQMKSQSFSPFPIKSATIKYQLDKPVTNPMQLFVLDISQVIENHSATWLAHHKLIDSPEEIMLYSLVAGRAEIIMFGGIKKGQNIKTSENRTIPDVVSNKLHIISAKREII